jgi:dipeptidyl aminopeptidase/acylaminoacyl peptidase
MSSAPIAATVVALLLGACGSKQRPEPPLTGSIVEYGRTPSGARLRGILYLPEGKGPFPALLYAHGSAPGAWSNEAFEAVAPHFTARGWAVFAPYRRGQGLSRDAGPYVRDGIAAARLGGPDGPGERLGRLLSGAQMEDQAKAFAWLSRRPFAHPRRIATMGNSFGGIIALLSASKLPVCASVDAAGGAESWGRSPKLRALMTGAATSARAPVMFIQARNDFDVGPSRLLHAATRRAGKPSALRLYAPFGRTPREGHAFAYRGAAVWSGDVLDFLDRACP